MNADSTSAAPTVTTIIAGRMARATGEIGHWAEYDYVLINDDADTCLARRPSNHSSRTSERERQTHLFDFVRELVARPN